MAKGSKTARNCYTCRYWTGTVRVVSPNFVEYPDRQDNAQCNLTGQKRPAWTHCKDHEKRWDF